MRLRQKKVNQIIAAAAAVVSQGVWAAEYGEIAESASGVVVQWGAVAAALAIGIGAFGAASAQGKAASAALEGVSRNPASRSEVFTPLILSLVFMELQALLCFVIAFLILGK